MKLKLLTLASMGALALVATSARAQYNLRGGSFYVNADAGIAQPQDLYIRSTGETLSLDPGPRVDLSAGYNVLDCFAVELQTGAILNQIDTGGAKLASLSGNRAYLTQVPMLANAIFKAPLPGGVTPYIGGGAGGVTSSISVRQHSHWTSDSDFVFAWQAMAGVNYALTRSIDVGVGYRLLGTGDHTWFSDDPAMYMPTGKLITHSAVATFTWSF